MSSRFLCPGHKNCGVAGRDLTLFHLQDLAVKVEGTFCLRYRVFNICNKATGPDDIPVLAECYGGPFRIYSTKEFPGLRASTDLTKVSSHLLARISRPNTHSRSIYHSSAFASTFVKQSASDGRSRMLMGPILRKPLCRRALHRRRHTVQLCRTHPRLRRRHAAGTLRARMWLDLAAKNQTVIRKAMALLIAAPSEGYLLSMWCVGKSMTLTALRRLN